MLYLEEGYFSKQIEFLEYFEAIGIYDVIVWLYPESRIWHLFGYDLKDDGEPGGIAVTNYSNLKIKIKHTLRSPLDKAFINNIKTHRRIYTNNCDSCALYKPGEKDWYSATVGHEGMCLVRDNNQLENLVKSGFSVTNEKPNWW